MISRRAALLLALLLPVLPAARADEEEAPVFVVRAGHLFDGEKVVRDATVVVRDGVFTEEDAPEGAVVIDARDGWVTPGLVDSLTSLGITGADSERTREVTPRFSVATEFDREDPRLGRALAEGVTAAYSSPGTANVISGMGAVVRAGPDGFEVAAAKAALEMTISDDPVSGNGPPRNGTPGSIYYRRPNTRMGVIWILRHALFGAAGADADAEIAAVRESLRSGRLLRFTARREEDIRTVVRVAREFGLDGFVVQDGIDAWRAAGPLAERGARVVLPPPVYSERGIGPDATRIFLAGAEKLSEAGIGFALSTGRGADGTGLREAAALARRFGLPREASLAAITSRGAAILRIDDRAGTVAPGRRADLVVWSGDPLELTSAVRTVIAAGEVVYEKGGDE